MERFMLSLVIEDEKVENIFLKEFESDKDRFFKFIKESFKKSKEDDLKELQISSMQKTWDNEEDKVWDEL